MAKKATTPRKPRATKPQNPKAPVMQIAVRSMRIIFNLEQIVDGRLMEVKEVPAIVYEGQFNQTLQSLATALLEQASRSPEPKAEGEDKKEE